MTNFVFRSLMVISLILTGIVLPLNNAFAQDVPPAPEDTWTFLPLLARNPFERIITPTPRPSNTPPATPIQPTPTRGGPTPTPGGPTPTPGEPTPTPGEPTPTLPPVGNAIIVDHTSIALFDQIPEQYLSAARNTTLLFSDRSVGQNIHEALDCLAASSWATSPASCRNDYIPGTSQVKTYTAADLTNGTVPELIQFPANAALYNRSNWTFEFRMGEWEALTEDFVTSLAPQYLDSKEVLTYQFSYLNVDEASNIADPSDGFFADTARHDINELEAFIAQHPDKEIFLWTTSLARSIGSSVSTQFNDQMRRYAIAHEKTLFDVADILSHDRNGQPCYDNLDDGVNYPAICADYTTELNGGHLGAVSGGKIQIAKAFWVLMAQIAGWMP